VTMLFNMGKRKQGINVKATNSQVSDSRDSFILAYLGTKRK